MFLKDRVEELEKTVHGRLRFFRPCNSSDFLIANGLKEESELYREELLKQRKQINELEQQLKEALSLVGVEYYEAPAVKGWRKVENEE